MRRLIRLGVERPNISLFKDLRMRIGVHVEDITKRLVFDERSRSDEVLKKSRIRYSRKFLLSFMELEICSGLPSGVETSIFREFDDGDLYERQRTADVSPSNNSSDEAKGSSQDIRISPHSSARETVTKCDGILSWLQNSDSLSQDCVRSDRERPPCPLKNASHCAILGSDALQRVPGCTYGLSVPVVQENGAYQLNKCKNPYRPPRTCKVEYDKCEDYPLSEKVNHVSKLMHKQDDKLPRKIAISSDNQNKNNSRKAPGIRVDVNIPILRSNEASDKLGILKLSNRYAHLLQASVDMTMDASDHGQASLLPKEVPNSVLESTSSDSSTLSKDHNSESDNVQDLHSLPTRYPHWSEEDGKAISGASCSRRNERLNSAKLDVKPCEISSVTSGISPVVSEDNYGSSIESYSFETGRNDTCPRQSSSSSEVAGLTLDMNLTEESHLNESTSSVQSPISKSSSHSDVTSALHGNIYADLDEHFLTSVLRESGLFGIEEDQSVYDDAWDEILWMIRTEQESSPPFSSQRTIDSEVELCLPSEDSLIADVSVTLDTRPDIKAQTKPDPGSLLYSDEKVLCLPDEDSLITIDDFIVPRSLRSTSDGNSLEEENLKSDFPLDADTFVIPDVTHCDDALTRPLSQFPSPLPVNGLMHCHNQVQTKMKQGKASPLDINEKPQINFTDRKTARGTDENAQSWRSPPGKPKGFDRTVCYSVLEQPMTFSEPDLLHRTSYKQDLSMLCLSPQYYLQVATRDYEGFGGYGNQATANSFIQMDIRSTHLQATACYGQNQRQRHPGSR